MGAWRARLSCLHFGLALGGDRLLADAVHLECRAPIRAGYPGRFLCRTLSRDLARRRGRCGGDRGADHLCADPDRRAQPDRAADAGPRGFDGGRGDRRRGHHARLRLFRRAALGRLRGGGEGRADAADRRRALCDRRVEGRRRVDARRL